MRIIFLLLFIFCFQLLAFNQSSIDVLHYKFSIGLNDANDTIDGLAEIKLVMFRSEQVSLNLKGLDTKGRGMRIDSVITNRGGRIYRVPVADTLMVFYKHEQNKLSVIKRGRIAAAQE